MERETKHNKRIQRQNGMNILILMVENKYINNKNGRVCTRKKMRISSVDSLHLL